MSLTYGKRLAFWIHETILFLLFSFLIFFFPYCGGTAAPGDQVAANGKAGRISIYSLALSYNLFGSSGHCVTQNCNVQSVTRTRKKYI